MGEFGFLILGKIKGGGGHKIIPWVCKYLYSICMMIQSKEPHASIIAGNFILEEGVLICGVSVQTVQGVGEVGE